ncbi:MAG: ribonuclease III [Planctomycetota bacterium]|nr:ribonuclease III [Planctomycetota bacterium]
MSDKERAELNAQPPADPEHRGCRPTGLDADAVVPDNFREQLEQLEKSISYSFKDRSSLQRALVHISAAATPGNSNERLEFLGDGILGFIVADILYNRYPESDEGELTQFRSRLVSTSALAEVARKLELEDYALVDSSLSKKKLSSRLLAGLMEAVVAAIYVDGGIVPARAFISNYIADEEKDVGEHGQDAEPNNYKSILQQYVQGVDQQLPRYRVVSVSGPDHRRQYAVVVEYAGMSFKCGYGKSKKEAEQNAARNAFEELCALESEKQ